MTRLMTLIVLAGATLPVALPTAHAADLDYGYDRPIERPYAYERPVVVERPVVYAPAPVYLPPRPYYARPFYRPWRRDFGYGYGPRPFSRFAYGPRPYGHRYW